MSTGPRDVDPSLPPVITIGKQKLHGPRAVWQAYKVREDGDGSWLFTPAGSLFRSREDGQDGECEVEGGGGSGLDCLELVPGVGRHWMATWRVPERALHLSADVCGWVRRERDLVVYEDWELDPFLLRSGVIGVEDLDEFVAEVDSGELSRESAERALRAAAEVEGLFKARSGPFDDRGDRLLAESGELGLPPLRQVPHPLEI